MDQNGKVQFIKSIISLECLLTSPAAAREPLSQPAPNQPPTSRRTASRPASLLSVPGAKTRVKTLRVPPLLFLLYSRELLFPATAPQRSPCRACY
jgi:hypothetical protein